MKYTIEDTTMTALADATRAQWDIDDQMTPAQIAAKIGSVQLSMGTKAFAKPHTNPITGAWERPSDWPDIEAILSDIDSQYSASNLTLSDTDMIIMTYDLRCHPDYHWFGFSASSSISGFRWYTSRLYQGTDGHWYTGENVATHGGGDKVHYDLTEEADGAQVQVWAVWSNSAIESCGFIPNSETTADNYLNILQPCVERTGYLPYCTNWGTSRSREYNSRGSITVWMERDALAPGYKANVTNLGDRWSTAIRLQVLDLSRWNTTNWHVTSLGAAFTNCYNLHTVDYSYWDTTNWAVTTLSYTWAKCYSLEEMNIGGWNTSNWAVTHLYCTWQECYNLKHLFLNNWNTSNWAVNNLGQTWYMCYNLVTLEIDSWDTSNWIVTNFASTWWQCTSLRKLELDDWDTSNWAVTNLSYTFGQCFNLEKLEIGEWNTSGWVVTTLSSTWQQNTHLKELKLNKWDTSDWVVTSFAGVWSGCCSLNVLEIDKWDTSKWNVSSISSTWSNIGIDELDLTDWDTSNWQLTNINNAWNRCYNMKTLDISTWDDTKWNITNVGNVFQECQNLETLSLPATMGLPSNSNLVIIPSAQTLVNYTGTALYTNHSYSTDHCISTASVHSILNRLPTVSSSKTITLGTNMKLKATAEDIAAATQKGWTVA